MPQPAYLYDPAWQPELERLRALEELFEPASRHFIARLGLAPGWRCLEVGGGAGGLVGWLADRVGASGHVLATDLDPRFLAAQARDNVEVRRHDLVRDPPIESDRFDLVHARAVLEHLADPRAGLARLASAVRPGGWLVVEDIDFGGAHIPAAMAHFVSPASRGAVYRKIIAAMRELVAHQGLRPAVGASLPTALHEAGLCDVGAELHAPFVAGGAARDCMRLTVEYLRPRLVGSGLVDDADIAAFVHLTRDTAFRYVPVLMVTAWGRRSA